MIRTLAPLAALALLLAGCAAPEEATMPTPMPNATNETEPTPATPMPSPTPAPTLPPAPDPTAPPPGPAIAGPNETGMSPASRPAETNESSQNVSATSAENGTWPVNGSFVAYTIHGRSTQGRGSSESWTNATWEFSGGEWHLSCGGKFNGTLNVGSRDPKWRNGTFATHAPTRLMDDVSPLAEPDERARGRLADREMVVWRLVQCEPEKLKMMKVGASVANVTLEGEPVTLDAHRGVDGRLTRTQMREFKWDPDTGLVLAWTMLDRRSSQQGWLTATDAPVGDREMAPDAPETAPPPGTSPPGSGGNATMDANATPGANVPSDANATV